MVPRSRTRPPVAADARPVRDPRLRGDAPADAGRARRAALRALAGPVADGRRPRGREPIRRDRRMAGSRLQPSRRRAPPRRLSDRRRGLARRPHRAPRRRPVHGRGHRELRLRRERPPARRQRRPRRATHRAWLHRRRGAGADGSRCDCVPRADPALRRLPAHGRVPFARHARRACAEAVALRGLVPSPPGDDAQGVADAPQRAGVLDPTVVEALERDGLVVVEDGLVRLPA